MITVIAIKDIAWLGGLLEGEGSFSMKADGYPGVHLHMTDRDVVERAAKLIGSRVRGPYKTKTPKGKLGKPVFACGVYGNRGAGWMMTIYQFLGERRQSRVRDILNVWKSRPGRPQKIWKAPSGTQTPSGCHPERPTHSWGLCRTCAQRVRRARQRGMLNNLGECT